MFGLHLTLTLQIYSFFLSLSGYKYLTAQSYIALSVFTIRHSTTCLPFYNKKAPSGYAKTLHNKDPRLPITLELLNTIIPTLQTVCNTIFEAKLLIVAFTLALQALLRIGEITLSKGNTAASIIQFFDISLQQAEIQLTIRHSKTDQLGVGTIFLQMVWHVCLLLCTIIYRSAQLKLVHCSFILKPSH